jgi:hypothetical protein
MFLFSGTFLCVVWRVHLLCFADTFPFIVAFCSLKVFTFAGIVGTLFLLPINYMGTEIRDNSEFQNKSLDSFSISNVNNGSHGWVRPTWMEEDVLTWLSRIIYHCHAFVLWNINLLLFAFLFTQVLLKFDSFYVIFI